MKNTPAKKALKLYAQFQGNFQTGPTAPLKKEADLASFYYPGVEGVLDKIGKKASNLQKYTRLGRTVAVIGTRGKDLYPILTAKAALLSHVVGINAVPLMISYGNHKNLANVLQTMQSNFMAFFCADLNATERQVLEATYTGEVPLLFHDECEAAAVVAGVYNAGKHLKKTPKKLTVTLEGEDVLAGHILAQLMEEDFPNLSLLDERGAVYRNRPNMNRQKKALVDVLKSKKDARTREEVLAETDVYISTLDSNISSSTTNHLPDKAAVISLKAHAIEKGKKQSVISTLPSLPNHITDLHIAAGLIEALCEGKQVDEDSISQAIKGLSAVYKSPKADRMVPGLLEKNLAKKIAKAIK